MAVLTRVTQEESVTMRADLARICLIDTCSAVRHLGFDIFSAIGYDAYVFYSPETFVCSGAAASVDVLILGLTRMRLVENETLRWVGTYRPKIKTIVLGGGPVLAHRLRDLFHMPSIATVPEKSVDRILGLPRALHLFCDSHSQTNAKSYPTIKHKSAAKTYANTSTFMSLATILCSPTHRDLGPITGY
jgi:hypothetical protein